MGREGPERFTASALAREVGVSKATIFHHFGSLDEIPLAALEEVFLEGMMRLEDEDLPLEQFLDGMGREVDAIAHNEPFLNAYFVFFIKGIFDPRVRHRLAEGGFDLHRRVTAALSRRLSPDEDGEGVARLVEVILDGLALHHLLMGDDDMLARAWRRFIDLIVEAQAPGKVRGKRPAAAKPRRTGPAGKAKEPTGQRK